MKEQSARYFAVGTDSVAVHIGIVGVPTADGALVSFQTLPGNSPKTNGNHIYVWQTTDNIVPWSKTPSGDEAIQTDSSDSTQNVKFPFEQKGYIVGYAVAPTPNAVCSTIYMPANQQNDPSKWKYADVTAKVVYYGNNIVQVQYNGLAEYKPATNKNWIGIWAGSQVPWSGDPIKKAMITQDAPPSGYVVFEGIQLLIGRSYVVGYFMVDSGGRTSLAASSSFTVGSLQAV